MTKSAQLDVCLTKDSDNAVKFCSQCSRLSRRPMTPHPTISIVQIGQVLHMVTHVCLCTCVSACTQNTAVMSQHQP
jgi:hypothetical protein